MSSPAATAPPSWRSRLPQAVLSTAVVALIFGFVFPKVADYGEVWATVRAMTTLEAVTLSAIALWNLASYWPIILASQPGLRLREAVVSNLASTAVANTLPGGGALGIGVTVTMQRSWGVPVGDVALAGAVSGMWNNFIKLGMPVVAVALVALTGDVGAGFVAAALVGLAILVGAVVLFALMFRAERLARRIGTGLGSVATALARPFRKGPVTGWDVRASRLRSETVDLVRARWVRLTVAAVVSHLSLFVVLLMALRHVGISEAQVSWVRVLAAFAFVRLLSAVPITPGGLGVVELGLTAAIAAGLDGPARNQVAAAVLVYRALTWFAPVPFGLGAWIFWRANRSWRRTPAERRVTLGETGPAALRPSTP